MNDIEFMRKAILLGYGQLGNVSPNPSVGAVIVKEGVIVGEGATQEPGKDHAEKVALQQAGTLSQGSTLYTTLEPCNHTSKRTLPCVPAIIAAGISRVVVGVLDPHHQVNGDGVRA